MCVKADIKFIYIYTHTTNQEHITIIQTIEENVWMQGSNIKTKNWTASNKDKELVHSIMHMF